MPYPEYLIAPMRGEMTDMGARELRTAQAVDELVTNSDGVVMLKTRMDRNGHECRSGERGVVELRRPSCSLWIARVAKLGALGLSGGTERLEMATFASPFLYSCSSVSIRGSNGWIVFGRPMSGGS